ncbi:MAG TPA: tetratricopeptide repeat protein [Nitrospirales bacterium]|nr:tetratricopeptide repeat protein [Nitrospirales bacterium]
MMPASLARNMLLAMLVLLGTGCATWSERAEANHALAILDDGVRLHVGGDPEAAIRSYKKVLSITEDPEMKAAARGNIGLALSTLGNTAAAQSKFETVVTLTRHPETKARALNNIGELLQTQGQPDAARASYEEALRLTTHPDLENVINKHLAELDQ